MQVFRRPILMVAQRPTVERFVCTNGLIKGLVDRFVAGNDLAAALPNVKALADLGITATLDELGENIATADEAQEAVATFRASLQDLASQGLQPNISIKLTMLGLDLGDDLAKANTLTILETAREVQGFVRIDMEGSAYVDRTMDLFEQVHDLYPDEVGIVIQTYLYRARADVERMIERNARVRLVKGAYAEPSSIAYPDKDDIDDNYRRLMCLLLEKGRFPAIATHDTALIDAARTFVRENGIPSDRFEFQMLYGVRKDLQQSLVNEGYGMRVYVPFGTAWYPYFTRRIAERPANAFFVLRQFFDR